MHYSKGEIVHTSRRVGPFQKYDWMILEFLGYDSRKYRKDSQYSLERYMAMNMTTGEDKIIYIPVEFYINVDRAESSHKTRLDVPDDSMEVCIMFDDLEHWLMNKRQSNNLELDKRNRLHEERLDRIKHALSGTISSDLRQGLMYHLVQKESPSIAGLNMYNSWKKTNPGHHRELVRLIYENTANN